jgi:Flp pilus assembly protein TadD/cytochrome b561
MNRCARSEPLSTVSPPPPHGGAHRPSRLLSVGVALVAGSGWVLYGPARTEMGPGAAALMLLHLLLGLGLGVLLLGLCLARPRAAGAPLIVALALCLGTGAVMAARAAGGDPLRGGVLLLPLHILSGTAVLLIWLLRSALRSRSQLPPPSARQTPSSPAPGAGSQEPAAGTQACLPLALLLLLPLAAGTAAYRYEPEAYYRALTATNAAQAENAAFPAGPLREGRRPWRSRPAAYCGSAGCHETEYREWLSSAHAAAGDDPFYQAARAGVTVRIGAEGSRWCQGCHEPEVVLSDGARGRQGGGTAANNPVAPSPPRGVDCLTCHATTRVPDLMGNGRFVAAMPSEYPFGDREEPALRWLHGFLIRLRPAPHRAAFLKPELHRSAEFCASCHRTSTNVPQNGYKFLPGADEYGAWRESPVSGNSIHGFYAPSEPRTCQQCHMRGSGADPPVSHAFLGGNTALPALQNDASHLRATERFLRDGILSLDLFALRRPRRGAPHGEEWLAPIESAGVSLRPEESVLLDAVLRNRGAGHDFPGGSGDLRDVWVEVTVRDAEGRLLQESGLLRPDGSRGPDAHAYGLIALDRDGRRLERGELDAIVTTVPPFSPRVIPSGQADLVRYRLTVPEARGRLVVTARLLHRRVNPEFAAWALRGQAPGRALDLPLTVIAEDRVALSVGAVAAPVSHAESIQAQAGRFYDYGVALLGQRDLARAARAMRRVVELSPSRPEGAFGLGRVYLDEGDLIAARDQFQAALRLAPDEPRARLFLGKTHREMGQYERALQILGPLAALYPRDRVLQFEIGQCHLRSGRFEEAGAAFRRMLDLDPNDLSAHYNLMTCFRQLRRFPEARLEEAIYLYLKEDEAARRLAATFLSTHPPLAHEAQSTHEHRLRAIE